MCCSPTLSISETEVYIVCTVLLYRGYFTRHKEHIVCGIIVYKLSAIQVHEYDMVSRLLAIIGCVYNNVLE